MEIAPAYQGGTERQPPAESAGLDNSASSNTDLQ